MKTIAIRLEDETSELLTLVAQLEGTSQIEQIREAIASHLERKVAGGDLTARAQEALDEVEREASAKRKAIEQLVTNVADTVRTTKPTGRRRGSQAKRPRNLASGSQSAWMPEPKADRAVAVQPMLGWEGLCGPFHNQIRPSLPALHLYRYTHMSS